MQDVLDTRHLQQMQVGWLSFFSIARYVPDPIRDEPRNIGVLVLCPDRHFGGCKFSVSRTGIAEGSPQHRNMRTLVQNYEALLPGEDKGESALLSSRFAAQDYLTRLQENYANLLQFSAPSAAVGEPSTLLKQLYRQYVMPPHVAAHEREKQSIRRAGKTLRLALEPQGRSDWVHPYPRVQVAGANYHFDLGIRNGRLYYAVDLLSFRANVIQQTERKGAWYSQMWKRVADETGARAIVLVEPPSKPGLLRDHYDRVTEWVNNVGVEVRTLQQIDEVANDVATKLSNEVLTSHD